MGEDAEKYSREVSLTHCSQADLRYLQSQRMKASSENVQKVETVQKQDSAVCERELKREGKSTGPKCGSSIAEDLMHLIYNSGISFVTDFDQ